MNPLEYIFKRATDEFIRETEEELYKYQRYLQKKIEKKEDVAQAKELLKKVNQALGESGAVVTEAPAPSEDYNKRQERKREHYKRLALKAIHDHFDLKG